MQDTLEKSTTAVIEKMWAPFGGMAPNPDWWGKNDWASLTKVSPWLAVMRSAYDVNMHSLKIAAEYNEEVFFNIFKESPVYSASMESQLRDIMEGVKQSHEAQAEAVKSRLEKMESLIKDAERSFE